MHTLTDGSHTRIAVERVGVRDRVHLEASGAPGRPVVRPMLCPLPGSSVTRISLVPDGALLLADDAVHLKVHVGAGVMVEIVEPGGTVAYDMRGGSARWRVDVEVEDGGALTWAGRQFVAAAGSSTHRATRIELGEAARFALRETLVLGRHSEPVGGCVHSDLEVRRAGRPLLLDGLALDQRRVARLALGDRRVVGSVLVAGVRLPDDVGTPGARFDLEGPGTLLRSLSDDAHDALDPGWWSAALAAVTAP